MDKGDKRDQGERVFGGRECSGGSRSTGGGTEKRFCRIFRYVEKCGLPCPALPCLAAVGHIGRGGAWRCRKEVALAYVYVESLAACPPAIPCFSLKEPSP